MVLAAGLGTRLRPVTWSMPKPMVPVVNRPVMEHIVRLLADPDGQQAEFAIGVRSDMKGRGLGWLLMRRIIAYAGERGIGAIVGDVLRENQQMIDLARDLGFRAESGASDPAIVRLRLDLGA